MSDLARCLCIKSGNLIGTSALFCVCNCLAVTEAILCNSCYCGFISEVICLYSSFLCGVRFRCRRHRYEISSICKI